MTALSMALTEQLPVQLMFRDDIYQYLCDEFTKLCSSDEFIKAMKDANLTPACESGDEYQAFVDRKTDLFNSLKDYLLAGEK
ncbi:MAG: hypothetical protein V8R61_10900 [Enterocloster sp.]